MVKKIFFLFLVLKLFFLILFYIKTKIITIPAFMSVCLPIEIRSPSGLLMINIFLRKKKMMIVVRYQLVSLFCDLVISAKPIIGLIMFWFLRPWTFDGVSRLAITLWKIIQPFFYILIHSSTRCFSPSFLNDFLI